MESLHAVLIVGMDNTNAGDNEKLNYIEIKNTWPPKWGFQCFSKIGFDVLLDICHEDMI